MGIERIFSERRTIRRFKQKNVPDDLLLHLADMARYASCGSNKQLIRYIIVRETDNVRQVFETTRWAGMVAPRRDPRWGVDAPLCFFALTVPRDAAPLIYADAGAAVQSMELAAWERGLGCCWFASFDPEKCEKILNVSSERKILFLLAVGYPDETPITEDAVNGNVAYYLDNEDVLHVPKLPVKEIVRWA